METEPANEKDDRGEDHARELRFHRGLTAERERRIPVTYIAGFVGFEIDREIFSIDVVLQAGYKFADRCHVFLQGGDRPNSIVAMLRPKSPTNTEELLGEFANELIDQGLRERLERQFGDVRTLIVAQAFSEGNLLDRDREDGDVEADPRQIGSIR